MGIFNLGNVVGLLRSETAPSKTYVLWGKILNPSFPDIVEVYYYDDITLQWTPVQDPTTNYWLRPVIDNTITTPPVSPLEEDRYLIPNAGTTGAWVGHENQVAEYKSSVWQYQTPLDGFIVTVRTEANKLYDFQGIWGAGGLWVENDFQVPVAPDTYIPKTEKGAALGVAELDASTKILNAYIIEDELSYNPASPGNWPVGTDTIKEALDHLILNLGGIGDAPFDGARYGRKDGAWVSIEPYIISYAVMSVTNGISREVGAKQDVNFTASINNGSEPISSQTITTPLGFTWTTDPEAFVQANQEKAVRTSISYTAQVDDGVTVDNDTDTVQYVFPIFKGSSATILTGAQIYTNLTKDITTIGNKNVAFNFTDEYAYFCFDADYNDASIVIKDGSGFDVTSLFTKFSITVDSGTFHAGATGGTDWTKSYDVYRTTNKTDINATYQFLNVTE